MAQLKHEKLPATLVGSITSAHTAGSRPASARSSKWCEQPVTWPPPPARQRIAEVFGPGAAVASPAERIETHALQRRRVDIVAIGLVQLEGRKGR